MPNAADYDELDLRIAVALQANGRATWGLIAKVLDVPVRTVTRRGQRLLDTGVVRVSTYLDTTIVGETRPLVIQIGTAPGKAMDVARVVAERADASSVSVIESGSDVICQLMPRTRDDSARLVLEDLPAIEGLTAIRVGSVLKFFRSGYDWTVLPMPEPVLAQLRERPARRADGTARITLSEEEEALVAVLAEDGRVSTSEIGERIGVSAPTAKRRLDALLEQGALHVRTEVSPVLHGLRVEALTWIEVRPDRIEQVGASLAGHPAVRWCASCTGMAQMLVDSVSLDERALYRFLTEDVAALGVEGTQTAVVLSPVRRGPMLVTDMTDL